MSLNKHDGIPFAQIANSALRDQRLSFTARGILAYALSHTGEWRMTRDDLRAMSPKEGQKAIQNALNELTDLGYRKVTSEQDALGHWSKSVRWFHVPTVTEPNGR